jgi:putative GTP pyrophosphokinase
MAVPDKNELQKSYQSKSKIRAACVRDLTDRIEEALAGLPSPPLVKGRVKNFDSYYKKYIKLLKDDGSGAPEITDLLGIRIICPFIEDLALAEEALRERFSVTEVDKKGAHFSFKEFGYESVHLLIEIPPDIAEKRGNPGCKAAEVQIRTILQDAWAEVEHELVYKAEWTPFDEPMKRKLAAVNASLSLADMIFQEIRTYQRQLNGELGKRRESFFKKIEDEIDAAFLEKAPEMGPGAALPEMAAGAVSAPAAGDSVDDLLLKALSAHNKGAFDEAIAIYSKILSLRPKKNVESLIYKHRGMANFAQSNYDAAVEDFTRALETDPGAYKAAYYRGVVRSVLRRYGDAVEDFTASLDINPYQNFTLFRRAQAAFHLGDFPAALADCEASLALDPSLEDCRRLRALCREKLEMRG